MLTRFISLFFGCLLAFSYVACKPDHRTAQTVEKKTIQDTFPVDVNVKIVGFTYVTNGFGDSSVPAVVLDITLENKRSDTFYCNIWTACYSYLKFEPLMPSFINILNHHLPLTIPVLKGEKLMTRTTVRYRVNPERTLRAGFYVMTRQECEDSHFPERLTGKLVWSERISFPKFSNPHEFPHGEHYSIRLFRNDIIDTVDVTRW